VVVEFTSEFPDLSRRLSGLFNIRLIPINSLHLIEIRRLVLSCLVRLMYSQWARITLIRLLDENMWCRG
jgi:hypothetical protein